MAKRKRELTSEAVLGVVTEARTRGSTTFRAEQREKAGLGLDPLVDPSGFGVIRRSLPRYIEEEGVWILPNGVPMLEVTILDSTGSMGRENVDAALNVLKTGYDLLSTGPKAVLERYDTQIMTEIFGDVSDTHILKRSQAEMDVEIANQITLMKPECDGGDPTEDPQYGLFGDAYLTEAAINRWGLKCYHFTVSDALARRYVDSDNLIRVFGPTVFEKLAENGQQIDRQNLPAIDEIVHALLEHSHAFFFQFGDRANVRSFWGGIYGSNRVVQLPRVELLAHMKASIIGLTEGTLDLQSVEEFLRSAQLSGEDARIIQRALVDIPFGAQKVLPNFSKIPLAGSRFAKKNDLWPIGGALSVVPGAAPAEPPKKKKKVWL